MHGLILSPMQSSSKILFLAKASLVLVFLVIIAGSVVRMSGSGMGCPDWPKCFGHYIPPTDISELTYQEGKIFPKGKMMVYNDTLWVANENVTASDVLIRSQWMKYPKHDYAIFNPVHTWIEYINRLLGALSGIPVLLLFFLSFLGWIKRKDFFTFLLATATLFMLGFEAWLGKTVVDAELAPVKITLHMFGSMAIVALLLVIISKHQHGTRFSTPISMAIKGLVFFILLLSMIQVYLGTQVREEIDVVAKQTSDRGLWIEMLPSIFKIHRSFSIIVALSVLLLWWKGRALLATRNSFKGVVGIVVLEILVGVVLAYSNVPAPLQPMHLLLAILWFAFAWYLVLDVWRKKVS